MKLTRRQEEFIVNLIDLNRELDGPIHYSMLAERLGVSPFTAYDMLCVLEEKGMVSSEYQLAAGKSGPGRATRLFCGVTSIADEEGTFEKDGETADLDASDLKQFVLEKLRQGDIPNPGVAEALLARIPPDSNGAIGYCLEVMTIVALRLRERDGQKILRAYLPALLKGDKGDLRNNLVLIGGFAFGIFAQEETSHDEWSQLLLDHVRHYQDIVTAMTAEELRQLAESLALIFKPIKEGRVLETARP